MRTLRTPLILALALQLSCGPVFAEAAAKPIVSQKSVGALALAIASESRNFQFYYSQMRSRLSSEDVRGKVKQSLALAKSTPGAFANQVAHTSQTLFVIWIASIVVAAEQEYKKANRMGVKPDSEELKRMFLDITNKSINNYEVFAGIVGGGVFGMTLGTALRYSGLLASNAATRTILGRLLAQGALSLVTFLGWELCRHLWKEAIFALDTKEEVTAAEQLKVLEILTGKADEADKAIYQKVMDRAYSILTFTDPEMTSAWVYNTWRLTLMTGDFLTLLAAMTTASFATSAAATAILPGAGTITTFFVTMFGAFVGVTIHHLTPAAVKTTITKGLRSTRRGFSNAQLHTNLQEVRRILSYYRPHQTRVTGDGFQLSELKDYLGNRSAIRNRIMTVHFENVFIHYTNLITHMHHLSQVEIGHGKSSSQYKEYEAELRPLIKVEEKKLSDLADAMVDLYANDSSDLQRLLASREWKLPAAIEHLLENELKRVIFQLEFLTALMAAFQPSILARERIVVVAPPLATVENYLNAFYFFGYKEGLVQESLTLAGTDHEQAN